MDSEGQWGSPRLTLLRQGQGWAFSNKGFRQLRSKGRHREHTSHLAQTATLRCGISKTLRVARFQTLHLANCFANNPLEVRTTFLVCCKKYHLKCHIGHNQEILFVNPRPARMLILCYSFREPKSNFFLCRFYSIRSMDDIAADVNAKVPANSARCRCKRVGSTDDQSSSFDHLFTFPDHAHHRSRADVIHQSREERFGREICVVFFCQGLFDHFHLQRFEEVPFFFKPLDDLPHQSTLHAVWLDHDVGSFHGVRFFRRLCLLAMARALHTRVFHLSISTRLSLLSLSPPPIPRDGMAADTTRSPPSPSLEKKLPNGPFARGWGGDGRRERMRMCDDVASIAP